MKYALIGCGRISRNHIIAAKKNNLDIVAICDINENALRKIIEEFNLSSRIKVYTDYNKMLKIEELDFVAIATESGSHAEIALDCIKHGINVLIEKPIALSIDDANKIIVEANERNVKVGVVHQNRFNKAIFKLKKSLDKGELGKILYGVANIRWCRDKKYYQSSAWRGTWQSDGGALMNQCIHNIDLLCWMLGGKIEEVYGVTDNKLHDYIEVEDFGAAIIKSSNGSYGIIEGTTDMYLKNYEETLTIFCEKGIVKIGGQSVNIIQDWISENIDEENIKNIKANNDEIPPNIYGFGHTRLYKNMVEAITNNVEPLINGKEGKKALEVILAIYKSNMRKQIVKLPLENESTKDCIGMLTKKEDGIKYESFINECEKAIYST